MSEPLVSVLLPIHNAQEFLNIAIDGLLSQTYKNFEILVVDCSSSDQSSPIANGYTDERLKYYRSAGSDIRTGLQHAARMAKGKYWALMDQAGVSYPDRLMQQVYYLETDRHTEIAASNFDLIDTDSRLIDSQRTDLELDYYLQFVLEKPFDWGSVMLRASADTKILDRLLGQWDNFGEDGLVLLPPRLTARRILEPPRRRLQKLEPTSLPAEYKFWLRLASRSDNKFAASVANLSSLQDAWEKQKLGSAQRLLLEAYFESLILNRPTAAEAPLISVVMSVYNGGQFLKDAVQSILKQTFQNFEFIIIDDGSTDRSAKNILALEDPRIVLVRQTNHGLVYSLNKAIRLSRGNFIARMDADDISVPERFEKELSVLLGLPRVGVVGCFWRYIDEADKKSITMMMPPKSIDLKRTLYVENPFAHGSTIIRKEVINQAGGYRGDYGPTEDFDLWRRIAENWEFYEIPEVLYLYRITSSGISQTNGEIQAHYASKIMHEQMHKPLWLKSYKTLIGDGRYYQGLDSEFAPKIFSHYLDQQYLISVALFGCGYFKSGVLNSLALLRMQPKFAKRLIRPAAGGLMRRLGIRERVA